MNVKKNNYVRTNDGYIGKAIIVTEYNTNIEDKKIVETKNIIESKLEIKDLIQEGDLIEYRINGDRYISEVKGHPEFDKYVLHIEFIDTIIDLKDLDIISILTREQYNERTYSLEDKVD